MSLDYQIDILKTAALRLAMTTDQPTDSNGMIRVNFRFVSELIRDMQIAALDSARLIDQLDGQLKECDRDNN